MDLKLLNSIVFHNMRILHSVTPRDTYILNYKSHHDREGDRFFDMYHLAFWWGTNHKPKKIMEIGSRTGTSLVMLLSPYVDYDGVRVVLFDLWSDGLSTPDLVKKHLNHLGIHTHIEFYQGNSRDTVPAFMQTNTDLFDWILVDGDHSPEGAMIDLENAHKLVAPNGVIVFDDICEFDGVVLLPTWNEFKERYHNMYTWHQNMHGKGVGWAVRI